MRFTESGPALPDALLLARDEGRVVFFCGAGVSRAKAGLPDFFGLAESVIRKLGASLDSDACKVLKKAKELEGELEVTGLISADRVFSLLERDFTTVDIQSAVAKCLKPASPVDRSAHEILLRLARTPDRKRQLVTTNFDRLFEGEASDVRASCPPRLPQLSRHDALDGIVYLHGRVNDHYTAADDGGFILSSSEFGHAYLAEGWATEFFREIVRRFIVVFVGYSADDPPVHYLLEGLQRNSAKLNPIYAFQATGSAELTARWQHKGVEPLSYSPVDGHRALWETLEQWAARADDPEAWQKSVLAAAMDGPASMQPYERGQVAHIVSTSRGAHAFARAKPPAEWLCVFDPQCRYETPDRRRPLDPDAPTVDPFSLYGLDSDPVPERLIDSDQHDFRRRDIPPDAWDAFTPHHTDFQNISPSHFGAVRGDIANRSPALPTRLSHLGNWIASVATQPAALWWAARQKSLHPSVRTIIDWELKRSRTNVDKDLLKVWHYILEAWDSSHGDSRRDWYALEQDLTHNGWSSAGVRRLIALTSPYLKINSAMLPRPVPPTVGDEFRPSELTQLEVECPVLPADADIPDEWLFLVLRGLRNSLEAAARLCEEVGDYQRRWISPIIRDEREGISDYGRTHGLSGSVIAFASLFDRLCDLDLPRAREEFSSWPTDDDTVFARLHFWASGKPSLATPRDFAELISGLPDSVFWDSYHQRDLLLVISARWKDLSDQERQQVESRLLLGPDRWDSEEEESFRERRAWNIVNRLQWLLDRGHTFSFDVRDEIEKHRQGAPKWKPEYASHASESREIRGGSVSRNTDCSLLRCEPIANLLRKASELSGRSEANSLEEHDPFAGLCAEGPKRAYLALARAARQKDYPVRYWKTFLESPERKNDPACFSAIVAARLCRIPDPELSRLFYIVTWWVCEVGATLSLERPESFDLTAQRLIAFLQSNQNSTSSDAFIWRHRRDWVTEAINSPVGYIVRVLFNDARLNEPTSDASQRCMERLAQCLSLPGNARRYTIALVSEQLPWLYGKDAAWLDRHILSILDSQDESDKQAFWAGFSFNPQIPHRDLFFRIKKGLLSIATERRDVESGYSQALAVLILKGWISRDGNDNRMVTDAELRNVLLNCDDELRSSFLWQLARAISSGDASEEQKWQTDAGKFFQDVWPRQKSLKTSKMTRHLCEVLLASPTGFAALVNTVLPLLTTISDGTKLHIYVDGEETKNIIAASPEQFLRLLHTILPDNSQNWPWGLSIALDLIERADQSLGNDGRLVDLRRRLNAG